jgi:hypothetical protein
VPEVIQRLESLHRAYPAVNGNVDDELAQLLKPFVVKSEG